MTIRSLLLATALLAASRHGRLGAKRRRDRSPGAARQRHRLRRRGADRRRRRQRRHRGANRDLSRARPRHHRHAADRAGDLALRAHQVIGVDTRELREISVTRLARTLDGQGHRTSGRARAGAQERPRRSRQPQPDLRSRRAGFEAGCVEHRRDAAVAARFEPRNGRFDVTFEIANDNVATADAAALHRHRDRDRRGRGAGAQCRTQRGDKVLRRRGRAARQGGSRRRRRRARPRGRHAGAAAASRRPGAEDRRSRQARPGDSATRPSP